MIKKVQIYKTDKWNMLNVEVHGRQIIVREISDQWGEEAHTFLSRPELMNWAEQRFAADRFPGTPEEREEILAKLREV
ncbi:hypothetical protein DUZ99_08070 [Xylanibacillus composti]|uniref:Uncharacterized protein n=1 Tax=Xylanibacillus composti TaxID=1572762 RepID=A0A8J4GZQ3_9BACL|nr:hypothetical protein [Xylanibacillus composti]MDT9724949.1 hypothetical protein [Xylanibacillus composti]GIQ68188.1 hypothetical protein XYCOK13_10120 [Xylanibacillus composti]